MVFHWSIDKMLEWDFEELIRWHTLAVERFKAMNQVRMQM
ncbi:GpE family phage tail protein [Zooshikella sp. RANM57]